LKISLVRSNTVYELAKELATGGSAIGFGVLGGIPKSEVREIYEKEVSEAIGRYLKA
jgi:hypothetical protein